MSKENCILCQIVDGRVPSKKVYEDDIMLAVLDVNGANPGHCFIIPKQHYPIMEQVPDIEIAKIFNVANKISSAIFENLEVQGTNIFVTNGIPAGQTVAHFMVNVVPRTENDGINLQWEPKQLSEEEMSTVELKLKEHTANIGGFSEEKKAEPIAEPQPSQSAPVDDFEVDHELRQINRRIP